MAHYFARMVTERNRWADVPTIVEMFASLRGPDPEGFHASITSPSLIITGEKDGAHEGAFTLQSLIPNCELVTIEGAGHCCNMEKRWDWDDHALRFLLDHDLFPAGNEAPFHLSRSTT
jgi:pimeloyl-ACP methyl ester carboxylesterase